MELLQNLLENSGFPILTALILGLMTAISPCPLATNITAIGFISQDIQNRKRVFYSGLVYTLGRSLSYTLIGLLFYFSIGQVTLSGFFQTWGERLLGPLLILIALFMLGILKIRIPGLSIVGDKMEAKARKGIWGVFFLGIVFALAFCPYSGVLYFGMLIPLTVSSPSGLVLPMIFALGTGLPVILIAWVIAFSLGRVGEIYNKVKSFEFWFRRVVAVVFLAVGIFYLGRTILILL